MKQKGKRDRRYARVARILISGDAAGKVLSDEHIAAETNLSKETVRYCRIAYDEIREVLRSNGWAPKI